MFSSIKLPIITTTVAAVGLGVLFTNRRYYLSSIVHSTMTRPIINNPTMRTTFMDTQLIEHRAVPNHTHGDSAAARSSGTSAIVRISKLLGCVPYFLQMSASDQRAGRAGSREYYWAKDLAVEPAPYDPPDDALLGIVDVDYYMNMPWFLGKNRKPVMLYTFCPDDVCGVYENYSFTINADSEVCVNVTGGASYKHKIWNYGVDILLAVSTCFGVPYSACLYNVDRRRLSVNRYLIFLAPIGSWTWAAPLVSFCYDNRLGYMNYVHGQFTRLDILSKGSHKRATGRVDTYSSALVDVQVDDAIASMARIHAMPLGIPTIQTLLIQDEDTPGSVSKMRASALVEYHRMKAPVKPSIVYPTADSVRSYTPFNSDYSSDEKPSMLPFMAPIIHGCFAPSQCKANDEFAVTERVIKLRNDTKPTPFEERLDDEFLGFLIPERGVLVPCDIDEVYRRQDRPSQRVLLEEAAVTGDPNRLIKSFLKKEAYQDPKPPRVISTINPLDKLEYSQYTYPFADFISSAPWFAFKHVPIEIAEMIGDIAINSQNGVNSDINRMDGSVNEYCREFEKKAMLRAFIRTHHNKICELLRSQYTQLGVTAFGVWYETFWSRLSGSPETGVFNTMLNARGAYGALRRTKVRGAYLTPKQCYDKLGLYGGDDGFTGNVDPKAYVASYAAMGFEVKAELIKRGEMGVKFLSRQYGPDIWTGDINSCCDLPRALSKFHATVGTSIKVTPIDKLIEKSRAYALTDWNTPVMGDLVRRVMSFAGNVRPNPAIAADVPYMSVFDREFQYPNEDPGWMCHYAEQSLPEFDVDRFNSFLRDVTNLDAMLSMPLCMEIRAPKSTVVPIVVDSEVIPAKIKSKIAELRGDKIVIPKCKDCDLLAFDLAEAMFVQGKGYPLPVRCKTCRLNRKTLPKGCWTELLSLYNDSPELAEAILWYGDALSPLWEEVVKRVAFWPSVALTALETVMHYVEFSWKFVPTLLMHVVCFNVSLPTAIVVHSIWNMICVPLFGVLAGSVGGRAHKRTKTEKSNVKNNSTNMSSSSTTVVLKRPPPRRGKQKRKADTIVINKGRATAVGKARKRRRTGRGGNRGGASSSMPFTTAYLKSVVDPFEYGGCHLGWGCLVPSTVSSFYVRGTFAANNVDGSLVVACLPDPTQTFLSWSGGAAVAGAVQTAANNNASIAAQFAEGRVISFGIRANPSIAGTSAPGNMYAGAIPSTTFNLLNAMTPNDLISFPTSIFCGNANLGACATSRPIDVDSFAFYGANVTGWGAATLFPSSIPYIVFTGMPASTAVTIECVVNMEFTPKLTHGNAPLFAGDAVQDGLASEWITPDSLMRYAKNHLPSPGRVFSAMADFDAAALGGAGRQVIQNGVRSVFRTGIGYVPAAMGFGQRNQQYLR